MNDATTTKPVVCIDLKKDRIRIHRATLHMIGDPSFINLLVNPVSRTLAICKASKGDPLALRIRENQLSDGNCVEFGCRELIRQLQSVEGIWNRNCSYRIYGKCNRKESLAQFAMKDSVLVEEVTANE